MKHKKESGNSVDSNDIKKHKKDILRIAAELVLSKVNMLPSSVKADIDMFIESLKMDPFDSNSLKTYGLRNEDVIDVLRRTFEY